MRIAIYLHFYLVILIIFLVKVISQIIIIPSTINNNSNTSNNNFKLSINAVTTNRLKVFHKRIPALKLWEEDLQVLIQEKEEKYFVDIFLNVLEPHLASEKTKQNIKMTKFSFYLNLSFYSISFKYIITPCLSKIQLDSASYSK